MVTKVCSKKKDDNKQRRLKICSINIGGLSERSRFMLDKYVSEKNIDVLCVQETGTADMDRHKLWNMNVSLDVNKGKNKGCALFTRNDLSTTPLPQIAEVSRDVDSVWSLVVVNNKRYVIGTVYLKLGHEKGMPELLKMLDLARLCAIKYHAAGPLLIGDLNARHTLWGDSSTNKYGALLRDELDPMKYSILAPDDPTFLAQNGSSMIDLSIVSNGLIGKVTPPTTDNLANLYSGAPLRGHVPVHISINTEVNRLKTQVEEKLDLESIDWNQWTDAVDNEVLAKGLLTSAFPSAVSLSEQFEDIILRVSDQMGEKKKSTIHSKPFWTPKLSHLSQVLRTARERYQERNTDDNLYKLNIARDEFDESRKAECKSFILSKTKGLNAAQSNEFWKEINKIFNPKSPNHIESLLTKDDTLITEKEKIEEILFSTFFEGLHLHAAESSFDAEFHSEVEKMYEEITKNNFQPLDGCYNPDNTEPVAREGVYPLNQNISIWEIEHVIKTSKSGGKSFDNTGIHPTMLSNLGKNAILCLHRIFNMCLLQGEWIWNKANVIFLKKEGKGSYNQPGAYRPISISSYVGKLLEKILAKRLDGFLFRTGHTDPCQEGFTQRRNTVRYLNRLHLSIKGDIDKKLTVLCLFIDMEKAFDSVWKKGLISKLHKYGVTGPYLRLLNDFLMNRFVTLTVNGFVGPLRRCLAFGLPQGSALSPVLFKFFLIDILEELEKHTKAEIYKFADDGTVKAIGNSTRDCVKLMAEICTLVYLWTCKWRMLINCSPNKTEIVCFNVAEKDRSLVPTQFKIGENQIKVVSKTKVLGLTMDQDLNFKDHRDNLYKRLCLRWITICRYTSRNWGLNQRILVRLGETLILSSMFYAGIIWMREGHLEKLEKLWYKLLKTSVGAVFNIRQTTAEVILGIPPLKIINRVNTTKHYLKINIFHQADDKLRDTITDNLMLGWEANPVLKNEIKNVFHFLRWSVENTPEKFSPVDKDIISARDYCQFGKLSSKSCTYTKAQITSYTEQVWQMSLVTQSQMNGDQFPPVVSCSKLQIPNGTERGVEVLFMSLLYPNNLMNHFTHKHFPTIQVSPWCACGEARETPYHIIMECRLVPSETQALWSNHIDKDHIVNKSDSGSELLLGLSREVGFVRDCIDIITSEVHNLRTEIILPPKKLAKKAEPHDKPTTDICSLVKYHPQPVQSS